MGGTCDHWVQGEWFIHYTNVAPWTNSSTRLVVPSAGQGVSYRKHFYNLVHYDNIYVVLCFYIQDSSHADITLITCYYSHIGSSKTITVRPHLHQKYRNSSKMFKTSVSKKDLNKQCRLCSDCSLGAV